MFEYRVVHKFDVGDRVVCMDDANTRAGKVLIKGQEYTVTQLSAYHGMDQVYVEGIPCRLMAYRFERVERNPWLRRKSERKERLAAPIRVDFGPVNIPNIVDNWPPSTPSKDQSIPTSIGGTWDFNIPSVIVLNGLNIPSVITFSGIGDT